MKLITLLVLSILTSCGQKISAGKDAQSVGKAIERTANKVGDATVEVVKDVADGAENIIDEIKKFIDKTFGNKTESTGVIDVHTYQDETTVEVPKELSASDNNEGESNALTNEDDFEVEYILEGLDNKTLTCRYQRVASKETSNGSYVLELKSCQINGVDQTIEKVVYKVRPNGKVSLKIKFLQHKGNLLIEDGVAKRDLAEYNQESKRNKVNIKPVLGEESN